MLNLEIELNENERKTREIFNTLEWSSENTIIAQIFRSQWAYSLDAERIEKLAEAMFGGKYDLKPTLTKLVKRKILRSRIHGGRRLYEVNF